MNWAEPQGIVDFAQQLQFAQARRFSKPLRHSRQKAGDINSRTFIQYSNAILCLEPQPVRPPKHTGFRQGVTAEFILKIRFNKNQAVQIGQAWGRFSQKEGLLQRLNSLHKKQMQQQTTKDRLCITLERRGSLLLISQKLT